MTYPYASTFALALVFAVSAIPGAAAAGSKKSTEGGPATCGGTLPYAFPDPLRGVYVSNVEGVQVFQTPNRVVTELHAELREMAKALLSPPNTRFAPIEDQGVGVREGDTFVQLNLAVTNFTLESLELGISFGYNNNNPLPIPAGVQVSATGKIRLGSIRMAFGLARCTRTATGSRCATEVSTESTQKVLGSQTTVDVQYGLIHTGVDLVTRTDLGEKLRKIMLDGIAKLAAHPGVKKLPWNVPITHVGAQAGSFWMNAGVESYLAPFQSFVIYESSLAAGMPEVFHPLACAHTTPDVFDGSSRIAVDRQIEPGALERITPANVVRVGTEACAQ
jgi:hypothetical protein